MQIVSANGTKSHRRELVMRVFVAVEVPEALRDRIQAFVADRRRSLPLARWIRRDNLHLTLAFVGEVDDGWLTGASDRLRILAERHPRLQLRTTGAGAFPPGSRTRARVLWLGIDEDSGLSELQSAIARSVGLKDRYPFRPHVTLARCPQPWSRKDVRRFVEEAHGLLTGEPFVVSRFVLMESTLSSRGARYSTVDCFDLGAASVGADGEAR